ncbi:MAG: GHKL domain-containing protein [Clostridia bacterium]|nr:GHKL domain-containing protein [Clostridia bacterium]
MTFFILDTFFGFFQMLIIGLYFYKAHGAKNKWLALSLVPIIGSVVLTVTDLAKINPNIRVILNHIAIFLMFTLLFKGKISKKIATFFVYFCLSFACDFLVFTLTGSLGIQNELVFVIIMNIMMLVLLSLILAIAAKFMSDFGKIYDKRLYLVFILIPITQFGFIAVLITLMNSIGIIADSYRGVSAQNTSIIVSVLLIFALIADMIFLDVTHKAAENFKNKERLKTLESEAKMNYKYYEELQENADKMRKYRHDTNNIIQSIYSILESPDKTDSAEALKLAKTLEKEINSINISRYCSNTIVNAVLSDKEKVFSNSGIICNFNVNIPQNISISGFDLCRVFSNMLDNALEACRNSNGKTVCIDASIIDEYLYIKMKNPVAESMKVENKDRGNGLEIMKQITDKYDGETIITVEKGIFETLVTMKCSQ